MSEDQDNEPNQNLTLLAVTLERLTLSGNSVITCCNSYSALTPTGIKAGDIVLGRSW